MERAPIDITVLLAQVTEGDQPAASKLVPVVYDELRRLAGHYMCRERADHTLQAAALVQEAYLKMAQYQSVDWQNRAHFFGIAAQVMRHILVDHALDHGREKRGAGQQLVFLDEGLVLSPKSGEVLKLDESLERLAKLDPRQAKIVELRFFCELTVEETAHLLGYRRRLSSETGEWRKRGSTGT